MFNVSIFGNTADIYAIVLLVPQACQHITVDQRHTSSDVVAKTQTAFIPQFRILLKTGAAFWNSVRNRRCTVTTDEVLAYSKNTK